MKAVILGLAFAVAGAAGATAEGIRGDAEARAAAEKILANAGGREAWRKRQFEVREIGYLPNGETAELRIWRDFASGSRRLDRTTPSVSFTEWVSPDGGWTLRNGEFSAMGYEELAIEVQGLKQEPYSIYYRLAHEDPALRADLRDNGSLLYIYDEGEHLLAWFQMNAKGETTSWANFYDGSINQHYYGPYADMGDANLPRWGVQSTGRFKFEYKSAKMSDRALAEPERASD